ncbi:MAG: sigma-54-dependent Fis family transcriptional regulator, partial [Deltaproteobacteria bacterium]|nr:sigma-54-dependent Fis family transcriptional regulator [Deltaproteobacteria bacterium]
MNKDEFKILIIDDEVGMREGLQKTLLIEGFDVQTASTGTNGLDMMRKAHFDLAFIDYKIPDLNGIEIIKRIDVESLYTVIITAYASVESAVNAMKLGASDYLRKPFDNQDIIDIAEKYFRKKNHSHDHNTRNKKDICIYKSKSMESIMQQVKSIAKSHIPALIQGESGTGKEIIARLIYQEGDYAGKPFVCINCAAIPSELLESELFGYEKGAFSGAIHKKIGKFELAEDGIIFLDEIGDMDINLQAKLLRVLEEKTFERIGGLKQITVGARVISSTNANLKNLMNKKKFRSDLYYRLNGIQINLPPLRERTEDIEILANHFLEYYQGYYQKEGIEFSTEAIRKLKKHTWPGNIRELKHCVESIILLSK